MSWQLSILLCVLSDLILVGVVGHKRVMMGFDGAQWVWTGLDGSGQVWMGLDRSLRVFAALGILGRPHGSCRV